MNNRTKLQTLLEQVLGSKNVYFQPPPTIKLSYPAIIYYRDEINNDFADDLVYKQIIRYSIIVMDFNPDSEIVKKISQLPRITFSRHYKSDNLNHDVFSLYF